MSRAGKLFGLIVIISYFIAGLAAVAVPFFMLETPATEAYGIFVDAYGVRSDAVMEVKGDLEKLKPIVSEFADYPEVTELVWYGTLGVIPEIPGITDLTEAKDFLAYDSGGGTVYRIMMLLNVPPWEAEEVYVRAETALIGFGCERVGITDHVLSDPSKLFVGEGADFPEKALLAAMPIDNKGASHSEIRAALTAVEGTENVFSPFVVSDSEDLVKYILSNDEVLTKAGLSGMVGELDGVRYVIYVAIADPRAHAKIYSVLRSLAPGSAVLSVPLGRKDITSALDSVAALAAETLAAADIFLCLYFVVCAYMRRRKADMI